MKHEHQQCTPLDKNLQKIVMEIIQKNNLAPIINAIDKAGGQAILVGGAVRDLLLGLPCKDIDIEVHKLSVEQLENLLAQFGLVNTVGKSFGVLRVSGYEVDWSLPRTDSSGRKPQVAVDPTMTFAQACRRRDLTINALGIDLISLKLLDPCGGLDDLRNKILRAPDAELFGQDPLRFYRVFQFVSRFNMKPDSTLNDICKHMDVSAVSRERIEVELAKWLLKSAKPSQSIDWLVTINRLHDIFPEVAATHNVPQNPEWHPEGDVFEHTKQTLDAAAQLHYDTEREKLIIMYAALCHDLGKALTTKMIDGRWRSFGHAQEGVMCAKHLLRRITHDATLVDTVCLLVKYHLEPGQFVKEGAKPPAYKRLALRLAPNANLKMLAKLAMADKRGRNAERGNPLTTDLPDINEFLVRAEQANVVYKPEEPVLQGRDLMPEIQPGKRMGDLLRAAYELQINEGIKDKDELKARILKHTP